MSSPLGLILSIKWEGWQRCFLGFRSTSTYQGFGVLMGIKSQGYGVRIEHFSNVRMFYNKYSQLIFQIPWNCFSMCKLKLNTVFHRCKEHFPPPAPHPSRQDPLIISELLYGSWEHPVLLDNNSIKYRCFRTSQDSPNKSTIFAMNSFFIKQRSPTYTPSSSFSVKRWHAWLPGWEQVQAPTENLSKARTVLETTRYRGIFRTVSSVGARVSSVTLRLFTYPRQVSFSFRWITQDTLGLGQCVSTALPLSALLGSCFLFCMKTATNLHAPGH